MQRTHRRKQDSRELTEDLRQSLLRGRLQRARLILKGAPDLVGNSAWMSALCGEPSPLASLLGGDTGLAERVDPLYGSSPLFANALSRVHRMNPERADHQLECALLLLSAGANPNAWRTDAGHGNEQRQTVLTAAVEGAQFPALVELLLDHGASAEDPEAIRAAARLENTRCLEILLDRGARPDRALALHAAVEYENPEMLRRLVERGADPHQVDDRLRTPLHAAVRAERSREVVEILVDAGCDLDALEDRGLSAFRIASRHGSVEATDLLLERGANPQLDQVDTFYGLCSRGLSDMALTILSTQPELFDRVCDPEETMLVDAVEKDKREAVRAMLEVGFSVESSPEGEQPLHVAARFGRSELLHPLLDAQAPLRARNADGRTPLALAVRSSDDPPHGVGDLPETVRILLDCGARPEAWMLNCGSQDVVELLRGRL